MNRIVCLLFDLDPGDPDDLDWLHPGSHIK